MDPRALGNTLLLTTVLSGAVQPDMPEQTENIHEAEVRSFTAICHDASDDSVALQAALDSLPDGATLSIPCQLLLGSPVKLRDKTGVTITVAKAGAGFKALRQTGQGIPGGFGPLLFVVERCSRCTIEYLDIDLDRHATGGIGVTGSTETRIRYNTIRNAGSISGGALSASANLRNQYIGNTIVNTDGATRGLWIGNHWRHTLDAYPHIRNNTVRRVSASGIVTHAIAASIADNSVEDAAGSGIKCVPASAPAGVPTLIQNNILRANIFNGLQIAHGHDIRIQQNTIEYNGGAGIYAAEPLSDIVIENNIIRDNDVKYRANGWQGGILIHQGKNIVIVGNVIEDTRTGNGRTQTNGIWLNASQSFIRDIRIERNTISNHVVSGIQLSGSYRLDDISVNTNVLRANSEYGISVHAGTATGTVTLCANTSTGGNGYFNDGRSVLLLNACKCNGAEC
jgi:hypothetical protein